MGVFYGISRWRLFIAAATYRISDSPARHPPRRSIHRAKTSNAEPYTPRTIGTLSHRRTPARKAHSRVTIGHYMHAAF